MEGSDVMGKFVMVPLILLPVFITACSASETGNENAASDNQASETAAPRESVTLASLTGNAAAGKAAFAQCSTCHAVQAGVNKIGPSLHGIVGRKAGAEKGFSYSAANAAIGITWTKENLYRFLEKPQSVVPNTKMIFAGIPDAQKRADIITYLENPS